MKRLAQEAGVSEDDAKLWLMRQAVDAIKVKSVDTKSSGPKRSFVGEELQIVP